MKSLSLPLILIISLVFSQNSSSQTLHPNDVVDDTCRTTPYPDFCVSTLRSDPKSASATGAMPLGVILVDQIGSKGNDTLPKISALMSRAEGTKLKGALSNCRRSYATIVEYLLSSSRGSLISGNPKFAEQYMNDAANEMTSCDGEFKGMDNPLSSENEFVRKAASIVAAIAKTME